MANLVVADSIVQAWERSLRLFAPGGELVRFDSQRGPCVESSDVVLTAQLDGEGPEISDLYPTSFHSLVENYASGFLGQPPGNNSTVSGRLYHWMGSSIGVAPKQINQVQTVTSLLRKAPNSRYNIATFWDPSIDPYIDNPVSPLVCQFRLRGDKLSATLMARTVDAWLGGFPMFVGFARLLRSIADSVDAEAGAICFFIGSYHVYEMDLPVVRAAIVEVNE